MGRQYRRNNDVVASASPKLARFTSACGVGAKSPAPRRRRSSCVSWLQGSTSTSRERGTDTSVFSSSDMAPIPPNTMTEIPLTHYKKYVTGNQESILANRPPKRVSAQRQLRHYSMRAIVLARGGTESPGRCCDHETITQKAAQRWRRVPVIVCHGGVRCQRHAARRRR